MLTQVVMTIMEIVRLGASLAFSSPAELRNVDMQCYGLELFGSDSSWNLSRIPERQTES